MPDLEALLALPGVKPEHLADINVIRNSYIAAATHKPPMTASRLIDWTIDSNLVREGKLTPDKLLEKRACYDDEHFMALFNSAVAVQSGNDPMGRIFNSAGGQRAVKFLEAQMKAEGNAVDPALLEEARFELYARTEAWRGKEIRRTPDLGDSEVYAFMMEEAQKLGKEPAYRLDALERDLQTPAQTRERQSPEYWEKNERRSLGEPGAAKAVIKGYIQSPEETTRQLAARLNLPEAAIESFIGNQAKLYGLDLPGLIQEYRAYQAAEAKAKLALLGGPNSMFIK